MNPRQRFARNTLINIANTGIGFVLATAMTPYILHRMGTEMYGIWVFLGIFSVSGFFSLLDLGFQGATIKYVAEFHARNARDDLRQVVNTALFFFLAIGIVAGIGLLIFNAFWLDSVFRLPTEHLSFISFLIILLAVSFLFQFPAIAFSAILEGLQRYDYLRGISIVCMLASNGAILLFLNESNGLGLVFGATLGASLFVSLLYFVAVRRLLPDIELGVRYIRRSAVRKLIPLSSQLFASRISGIIFNNTDKILIGIFLTVAIQTDYDIVNKAHLILLSLLSIFNQAVLPASSELSAKQDPDSLRLLLLRSTKYASAFVLPAFIFFMLFPSEFIGAWVGDAYAHLGNLIRLYSIHIVLTMFVGVSSTMFIGINKVRQVLSISLWAAALNLVISLTLVKSLGITGLILGTTVANTISSAIYIVVTSRIFLIPHTRFFKDMVVPILPAAAVTTGALFAAKPLFHFSGLLPWVLVAAGTYALFFTIFVLSGLASDERRFVSDIVKRLTRKTPLPSQTP